MFVFAVSIVGVRAVGQIFVLLHCLKVGLNGRYYENWNTFFPWYQWQKRYFFQNIQFNFLNAGECRIFPRCFVRNNYIFIKLMKNEFYYSYLSFFYVTSSSGGKLDLKICKISSKTTCFWCSMSTKWSYFLSPLTCFRLRKCQHVEKMSQLEKIENVLTSSFSVLQGFPLKIKI